MVGGSVAEAMWWVGWLRRLCGGWLDQLGIKLTQSPTEVGVEVGTELGNSCPLLCLPFDFLTVTDCNTYCSYQKF